MPSGFKPSELAARYNVEQFFEDAWHAYSGKRTAEFLRVHIAPKASGFLAKTVHGTHAWSAIARKLGMDGKCALKIQERLRWRNAPKNQSISELSVSIMDIKCM